MANNQYVYIGEGVSEESIKTIMGLVGKFIKLNLWDQDIASRIRTIPYCAHVYLMIDADGHYDATKLKRLIGNFEKLTNHAKHTYVLLQVNGLEDELIKGFGSAFDVAFGSSDPKKLKKRILDHCSNEIKEKMKEHGFDAGRMWISEGDASYIFLKKARKNHSHLKRNY